MRILRLTLLGAVAALGAAVAVHSAQAAPMIPANGAFGFVNLSGNITVDTTDITLLTASKTLPATLAINSITDPYLGNPNNLGLATGDAVTFGPNPIPVPAGVNIVAAIDETVSVGPLTFTFTSGRTTSRVASGADSAGSFAEEFLGTLTGDTSGTFALGQSANLSESCTQGSIGTTINCSDTLGTPATIVFTPEPASLALLGSALFGFGAIRRRRKSA